MDSVDTPPTSPVRARGSRSSAVSQDPAETAETVKISPEVLDGLRMGITPAPAPSASPPTEYSPVLWMFAGALSAAAVIAVIWAGVLYV